MTMIIEKNRVDQRNFSIIIFSLFFGWLLSVPFEGQVLYTLISDAQIEGKTHNTIAVFAHFIGLFITGFLVKRQILAKVIMIVSTIICIIGSLIFFLPFSMLWYVSLFFISFFSGLFVASWGFYFKVYSKPDQRFKIAAEVLIYSNILMILINVVSVHTSALIALKLSIITLIAILFITIRLEVFSNEQLNEKINLEAKNVQNDLLSITKPLVFLCLFIFIITLNSGLMYQVVNPKFAHLTVITSYYWAVPYIVALLILRNLPGNINKSYILYIALIMIGLSFILFMWLDKSIFSYLVINTLMLGALGVCDLFWWSILARFFDYHDNPAKVLGIGLSMNVLGILVGGFIGNSIFSQENDVIKVSLIALLIIFIVMIFLPILNIYLTKLLKNHVFLFNFVNLEDSKQEKVIVDVWDNKNLTAKEIEVIKLILRGYTYKAISEQLFISENTTKFHVKNIYQKMNVNTKMELIKMFTENEK
ncbi:regulatory protein, luxR family [Desulfonispora thiosulfatigenes DSM 11270]|uniref:Regulatory protein, luxR family n=1 Tax=Desulfonispora thiosulfatigenes DSM 11270 TaxID=656914 RepID=A0A1W1V3F1_DESTI|nr:LuxR family transcriptional regulator [Desulfonispora thiosulfatigenes]SMB87816.1 regulatory protein, luxR family [Desulfonispora thiosulfatigenes DSM 11270]